MKNFINKAAQNLCCSGRSKVDSKAKPWIRIYNPKANGRCIFLIAKQERIFVFSELAYIGWNEGKYGWYREAEYICTYIREIRFEVVYL